MRKSYVRASGRLFATCARMAHRNGGVLGRGAGPQQRRPGPSRANSCFGETACVRLGSIVGGGLRVQRSLMSGAQSAAAAALRGPRTSMAGARALSPFAQGGRAGAQKALPHAASSIFPVRPWVFAFVTACCPSPPPCPSRRHRCRPQERLAGCRGGGKGFAEVRRSRSPGHHARASSPRSPTPACAHEHAGLDTSPWLFAAGPRGPGPGPGSGPRGRGPGDPPPPSGSGGPGRVGGCRRGRALGEDPGRALGEDPAPSGTPGCAVLYGVSHPRATFLSTPTAL